MDSKNIAEFQAKNDDIIFETLQRLGIKSNYHGYSLAALGIKYFLEMPLELVTLQSCYDFIASANDDRVNRDYISENISYAIEKREDTEFFRESFPTKSHQTPGVFTARVARYIALIRAKELAENSPMTLECIARVKGTPIIH